MRQPDHVRGDRMGTRSVRSLLALAIAVLCAACASGSSAAPTATSAPASPAVVTTAAPTSASPRSSAPASAAPTSSAPSTAATSSAPGGGSAIVPVEGPLTASCLADEDRPHVVHLTTSREKLEGLSLGTGAVGIVMVHQLDEDLCEWR